jgi:hypothetical protein
MTHHHSSENHAVSHGPQWLSMALALLLGAAAVVAGLTAWRAHVHSSKAQETFADSVRVLAEADQLFGDVSQAVSDERGLYIDWQQAKASGGDALAGSIWAVMLPNTQKAVTWWQNASVGDRPPSPFAAANPEWKTPSQLIAATETRAASDAAVQEAQALLEHTDNLELLGAFLQVAFLTGGLTATLKSPRPQMTLFGVSCAALLISTIGLGVLW